jgi:phytoene synthase
VDPADAYEECRRVARQHYENFPVASWLLPARMRRHVAAVYAFARAGDDFADEGSWTVDQRLALLAGWRARLHAAADDRAAPFSPRCGEPPHTEAVFVALASTLRQLALPVALLDDLLTAFEQDLRVTTYDTWADLVGYARLSAQPVGRLVLRIAGTCDERLDAMSDAVCTGLQFTNFWQDLAGDLARGRCYLPAETRARHGALDLPSGKAFPMAWRRALADAVARTRLLFEQGRPLGGLLGGRLGLEVRATTLGGIRMLDRIERQAFDVSARPTLGAPDIVWILGRLLR